MNQSIESLWKKGFLNDDALVAPRINNLYEQKSQNIVDKFQRMFKINLQLIMVAAAAIFITAMFYGIGFIGAYVALLLMSSVWLGNKHLKQLENIDKGSSSYDYLTAFDSFIKMSLTSFTKLYQWVYPLLVVGCLIRFGYSEAGNSIIKGVSVDFPSIPLVLGVPIIFPIITLIIAGLLTFFAAKIYKADMDIVYGREFKKLAEILDDMKSLKQGN